MKITIIFGIVLLLFCTALNAQTIYRLKNVERETYLGLENGSLNPDIPSIDGQHVLWEFANAGDNDFKIKNIVDGTMLNIEHGKLGSTPILEGWWSARWLLSKVEGTDYYRTGSKWKTEMFVNTQNGIACTEIENSWESAMWELEAVEGGAVSITNEQASTGGSSSHQDFLGMINEFRRAKGLNPVKFDTNLNLAAEVHSNDMASRDNLAHAGSNGSSFGDRPCVST